MTHAHSFLAVIGIAFSLLSTNANSQIDLQKTLDRAENLRVNDQLDSALQFFQQALSHNNGANAEVEAQALCGILYAHSVANHFDEGKIVLDQLRNLSKSLPKKSAEHVNILNREGTFYYNQFDVENSNKAYRAAIDYAAKQQIATCNYLIESHMRLGELGYAMNDFDLSQLEYTNSMKMAIQLHGDEHWLVGECLINLGYCAEIKGNHFEAIPLLRRAIDLLNSHYPHSRLLPRAYSRLAFNQYQQGDLTASIVSYQEVIRLNQLLFGAKNTQNIWDFNDIGLVYQEMGQTTNSFDNFKLAEEYHTNALELCKSLYSDRTDLQAWSYSMLANVWRDRPDLDLQRSLELHQKAVELGNQFFADDLSYTAYIHSNKAETLSAMKQWDDAEQAFLQSLALDESYYGKYDQYMSYTYHGLADMYFKKGDWQKCLNACDEGFACISVQTNPDPLHLPIDTRGEFPGMFYELSYLKARALHQGYLHNSDEDYLLASLSHTEATIDFVGELRTEFESRGSQLLFGAKTFPLFEFSTHLALDAYEALNDKACYQKAVQWADESKSQWLAHDLLSREALFFSDIDEQTRTTLSKLKNHQRVLEGQIAEASDKLVRDSLSKALFIGQENLEKHLLSLEKNYPKYFHWLVGSPFPTLTKISEHCKKDEALLLYLHGDSGLVAFAFTDKGPLYFRTPKDLNLDVAIEEFERSVNGIQTARKDPTRARNRLLKSGNQLYDYLLAPFGDELFSKSHWSVIADGSLSGIPFDALFTTSDSPSYSEIPYLVFEHSVSYAINIESWMTPRAKRASSLSYTGYAPSYSEDQLSSLQGLDDFPEARRGLKPLTFSLKEVEAGRALFGGQAYTTDATETRFKATSEHSSIIHLAMHALLDDEQPLLSKFVFLEDTATVDDGLLNLWELFPLYLNADLAILSACNSGAGVHHKGEGLETLARGFQHSGIPAVTTSLWQVDDEAGMTIIIPFLQQLREGQSKSEALRQAKISYLKNSGDDLAHPYFWSGLVLIGDNSPLGGQATLPWRLIIGSLLLALSVIIFLRKRQQKKKA